MADQDNSQPCADRLRRRIDTAALLERLQSYALGQAEMEAAQVKVAELLLKKSLPDLPGGRAAAVKEAKPAVSLAKIPPLTAAEAKLLRDKLHEAY